MLGFRRAASTVLPLIRLERHRGCRCPHEETSHTCASVRVETRPRRERQRSEPPRSERRDVFMMCVTKKFPSCVSVLLASPLVTLTPRTTTSARARVVRGPIAPRVVVSMVATRSSTARARRDSAPDAPLVHWHVRRAHRRGDRLEQVRGRARPDARGHPPAHPSRPQRQRSPPRAHRRTNEGALRPVRVPRARVFPDAYRPSRSNNDPTCRPDDHPSAPHHRHPDAQALPYFIVGVSRRLPEDPLFYFVGRFYPHRAETHLARYFPTSRARRIDVACGSDDSPRSPYSSNPARRCVSWRAPRACPRRGSPS